MPSKTRKEPVCYICGEPLGGLYIRDIESKRVHYNCQLNARIWKRLRALEEREKKRVN